MLKLRQLENDTSLKAPVKNVFNFFSSISAPSGATVTELVDNFNCRITNVINAIAPTKVKVLLTKKESPWRNVTHVRSKKRECRKAERRWRKNNLQVHYDIYKEILRTYNMELRNARRSYFSDIIAKNNNNSRALFAIVDRLTNTPVSVASELSSTKGCNDFAIFFKEKKSKN